MKSWRMGWAYSQVSESENVARHRSALVAPWRYWAAMVLKLVPRVWPFPVRLQLAQGGTIVVNDFMTLYIYNEIFVDGCYDVPIKPRDSPVIMDVGANTGLFMLRMTQLHPNARILGYEPLPSNFAKLNHTLGSNNLRQCTPFMYGIGGATRTEQLYIHPGNIGGNSIYKELAGDAVQHLDIQVVDIATEMDKLNGEPCSLLKLDCEGAEYEIIKRIDSGLARRIEVIVFEPTPTAYDVHELVEHLNRVGYEVSISKGLYIARYQDTD